MPDLLARTAPLYERVKAVVPPVEWPLFARDIDAILALKRARNAVILAHNYQTPEIFHCVADIVGDSLALAREAMRTDAEVIVLAGEGVRAARLDLEFRPSGLLDIEAFTVAGDPKDSFGQTVDDMRTHRLRKGIH